MKYDVYFIKAIARIDIEEGHNDYIQNAVYIHDTLEPFLDGDCIVFIENPFSYIDGSIEENENEKDKMIEYLLQNEYCETCFCYDEEKNLYYCGYTNIDDIPK